MALSALWKRLGRWSSAVSQLLQPFISPKMSRTKAPANVSQQPGQNQQPFPAPRAPPAGTRTLLPPPAPQARTRGSAAPSHTAVGAPRARRKPLAPAPPVRRQHHQRPAGSAKPSATPLASGSPPDTSTPMDWTTSPSFDISLASDVDMEEDTGRRCDISLPTDVDMEEDNTQRCDISLATDVEMEEENTTHRCDISVTTDVQMGEDTLPRAGTSLPTPSAASHSRAQQVQPIRGSPVTPAKNNVLHKKVIVKGSVKHCSCSKGPTGTSNNQRSSVPTPTDQAGTSGTSPQHNTNTSLGLPKKVPPAHCSVPATSKALSSTGHCKASSVKPQDPQQQAGTHLPPAHSSSSSTSPPATGLQRRAQKRKMDSGPTTGSKAKCAALGAGAQRRQ